MSVQPIRFRGIPASLSGVIADGPEPGTDMVIALRYKSKETPLELNVQSDVDTRILRVALPPDVAPGSYDGTLMIGDERRPVSLEVEASPQLRVVPEQLRIDAAPGDTVKRSLTMLNAGNVPVDLRRVQAFGVFMAGGVERALRRAYVRTLRENERRVDVIADNLADAHGGLVKMMILEGAGPLVPGALQPIEVEVKIPADLARGAVYGGNWELSGLVYPVTITVAGEPADTGDEVNGNDGGTPVIK